MKKSTKIIIAISAVLGIIYVVRKTKTDKTKADNKEGNLSSGPQTQPGVQVGNNATQTRNPVVDTPVSGGPQFRSSNSGIVWKDTTRRRCIDPDTGKVIYVDGPCPTATLAAYNSGMLRR